MVTPDHSKTAVAHSSAVIHVQIVYAQPLEIWMRDLRLARDSTVDDAIQRSHFLDIFPEYSIHTIQVGIYGQPCALTRQLTDNDRIEIYRPLVFDPMESRRRRARHRQRRRTQ